MRGVGVKVNMNGNHESKSKRIYINTADCWMTQKDGMGREVGGGFRMGNTCTPVVDSC